MTGRHRIPNLGLTPIPVLGFRYVEIAKDGDFWVAEEVTVYGEHIRAVGATSEAECRAAVNRNQWNYL